MRANSKLIAILLVRGLPPVVGRVPFHLGRCVRRHGPERDRGGNIRSQRTGATAMAFCQSDRLGCGRMELSFSSQAGPASGRRTARSA